jgi:hypothetical protein
MSDLATTEAARFAELEQTIEHGLEQFNHREAA